MSDFIINKDNALVKYTGNGGAVIIPEGVTWIYPLAFQGSKATLTSVKLPTTLIDISSLLFANCNALTEVEIPDSLSEIRWEGNFLFCEQLRILAHAPLCNIVLKKEKARAALGYLAAYDRFPYTEEDHTYYRTYLKHQRHNLLPRILKDQAALRGSLRLGMLAPSDYDHAIEEAAKLANAEINAMLLAWGNAHNTEITQIRERTLSRKLDAAPNDPALLKSQWSWRKVEEDTVSITEYKGSDAHIYVPATIGNRRVTAIASYALAPYRNARLRRNGDFLKSVLTAVTLPAGITTIGEYAFFGAKKLTESNLPDTVTTIGKYAFFGSAIHGITLPASVKEIGACAFEDCSALTTITIPSTVTRIGYSAFSSCTSLNAVTIERGISLLDTELFTCCYALTKIEIPDTVTTIGIRTFANCTALAHAYIPASVTMISHDAFYGCKSLTIHGKAGSAAEQYAKKNNIPFVAE